MRVLDCELLYKCIKNKQIKSYKSIKKELDMNLRFSDVIKDRLEIYIYSAFSRRNTLRK